MKFFYQKIELWVVKETHDLVNLKETVFVGVEFKDHKNQTVTTRKEHFSRIKFRG